MRRLAPPRLDDLVADRAGLSRGRAADAVRAGRVTVDGAAATRPTEPVAATASVALDGAPLEAPIRLALWFKPLGVHSTVRDDHGRPSLGTAAAELLARGLHPVGRLDADTDGLLLFSREGALTQRLLHPKRAVPRVYRATVSGLPDARLGEVLAAGVRTSDGVVTGRVLALDGSDITLEVREGKYRMVRRMLANAGFPVTALRRRSFGPLELGDLAPGEWRAATAAELAALGA